MEISQPSSQPVNLSAQPVPPVVPPEIHRTSSHVLSIVLFTILVLAAAVYAGLKFYPWAPVEELAVTPSPSLSTSVNPTAQSGWTRFASAYLSLSFDVPPGFSVNDAQTAINISYGPIRITDIGSTNAFFHFERYGGSDTKQRRMAEALRLLKNPVSSTIFIDGSSFPTIEGDDYGRFEGDSAGRVFNVYFDASSVEIIQRPMNEDVAFDPIAIGKQILTTMRFSNEQSGWETYTNATGLFSVKVPVGFRSDERYAPNLFLTQVNTTGTTMPNAWDIEIGSPEPAPACSTDAACFQILETSFRGAVEAGSTDEFREVSALIDGSMVKGFEAWGSGSVRYTFPLSRNGKYFTLMFQIGNTGVTSAPERLSFFSLVQEIATTFTFSK
ncbi:MAG: hypothetical protein IT405_00015 [Candidatus Yanofskybacteria bacterium]|nr:hypothetical protein [Candidatus Yanofskybacteria bacterium]